MDNPIGKDLLFVLKNLAGGGAERTTLTLAGELARRGHRVTLVLFSREGEYFGEIDPLIRLVTVLSPDDSLRRGLPRILAALYREAQRHDVVVGAIEGWVTFLTYLVGLLARKPAVGWVHIPLPRFAQAHWSAMQMVAARFVYPRLDRVICVSEHALKSLREFAGDDGAGRWRHIYNAHRIPSGPVAERDGGGLPGVLAVGRLSVEQKGFDLLVKAHARLVRDGVKHTLTILGEGPDRPLLESLRATEGVTGSVALPGFVRDVGAWYDRADLLAIPSHYEGFPLVGIEAMSCGLPVVAADCEGGVREMLADGECGELVRPNDVDALAAGLCKLLIDPAARRRLAERGLQRVRDFAPEQVAVKWEDLFAELLDR